MCEASWNPNPSEYSRRNEAEFDAKYFSNLRFSRDDATGDAPVRANRNHRF